MRRIGIGLKIMGIMLMGGAMALMLCNRNEAAQAGRAAREVLIRMEVQTEISVPEETAAPEPKEEMPRVSLDGKEYIGVLSVPVLELELPVLANWSYEGLKTAPCRYAGSLYTDDLVVMAHNYSSHFGKLDRLKPGDLVEFTDATGMRVVFYVAQVEILEAGAVEEMAHGAYSLTLFTCTYGGEKRITVRCNVNE